MSFQDQAQEVDRKTRSRSPTQPWLTPRESRRSRRDAGKRCWTVGGVAPHRWRSAGCSAGPRCESASLAPATVPGSPGAQGQQWLERSGAEAPTRRRLPSLRPLRATASEPAGASACPCTVRNRVDATPVGPTDAWDGCRIDRSRLDGQGTLDGQMRAVTFSK